MGSIQTSMLQLPDWPGVRPGTAPGSFTARLTNPEYHSIGTYISHSGMRQLLRSDSHFANYLNSRGEDDGFNFGTAAHCAILEPEEFKKQYVLYEGRRAGKDWEAFKAANAGKVIFNQGERDRVLGVQKSLERFPDFPVMAAIRSGESEKSIFWVNEETGAPCRIRLDSINRFAIFDLKTIDDARPFNIASQIMRMDYDLQAYMYVDGVEAFTGTRLPFNFIFAEDKPPHAVWLYCAGQTLLESGREKFLRGAKAFMRFDVTNPRGYEGAFSVIEAPFWRQKELISAGDKAPVQSNAQDDSYL